LLNAGASVKDEMPTCNDCTISLSVFDRGKRDLGTRENDQQLKAGVQNSDITI